MGRPRNPTPDEIAKQEEREREERRIERQRNLFTFLLPSLPKEALLRGMLQRAYNLLWDGHAEECDAILEFLPSREVVEMLNAWSDDQDPDTPPEQYSAWYRGPP